MPRIQRYGFQPVISDTHKKMAVTYFITKFVTAIEHVQCLMLRAYLVILHHRRDTFLIPGTVQLPG